MPTQFDRQTPLTTLDGIVIHVRRNGVASLVSGLGGALAIWLLATMTQNFAQLLLIAPFGASCVLLFALPSSPLARPRNVVGGHVLTALMGILTLMSIGDGVIAMGVGVGLGIAIMQVTGTLHPPAGGNPLVVIMTGAGWSFLALPILAGALTLLLVVFLYHKYVSKFAWPV